DQAIHDVVNCEVALGNCRVELVHRTAKLARQGRDTTLVIGEPAPSSLQLLLDQAATFPVGPTIELCLELTTGLGRHDPGEPFEFGPLSAQVFLDPDDIAVMEALVQGNRPAVHEGPPGLA